MSAQFQPIEQTLRRARLAIRLQESVRAAALVAGGVAVVLLAAFLVTSVAGVSGTARPWFLAFAAGALAAAIAAAALPFVRRWSDDALAKRIGDRVPGVGDSLLSAVQLHRDADTLAARYDLSRELIDLHVERSAGLSAAVDPKALTDRERTKRLVTAAGSLLLFWGVLALVFPGVAARSRHLLFGVPPGAKAPEVAAAPGAAPRLGDVTVTYRFPDYTGREPETFEGTDGALRALKGTIAEVRLKADRPVKSASILLNGKDSLPLSVQTSPAGTTTLAGEMSILENGTWTVRAEGADGAPAANDALRTITVEADAVPTAQIVWPLEENLEVNELEDVDVTWGVEDDFGVREVVLVWENHPPAGEDGKPRKGKSGRVPLATFPRENPLRHGDRLRWALATLGLEPGGYVEYWVEVTDNDTVSGPKKGTSQRQRLFLLSSEQIHDKAVALQEQLLKRMIHLLGDHLELEPRQLARERVNDEAERLEGKSREVARALDTVAEEMLKDPLGDRQVYQQILRIRGDLAAIASSYSRRMLESAARSSPDPATARRDAFAFAHDDAVPTLEKDVLFLDKLIQKQRFDGARDELAKLVEEQKDLKSMLERYKNGDMKDAELAKALEARLREIEKRMAEVAAKMASTLKAMPSDFDNSALEDDLMSQIRKALEEGRMEDAAALTEQLLQGLEQMAQQMDDIEQEFNLDPELAKQVQEAQQELAKLSEEQRKVLDETNQVREQIQKRQDSTGEKVNDFAKKELEKVKQLREELDRLDRQGMTDPWMRGVVRAGRASMDRDLNGLETGLKSGELGDALQHAQDIEQTLESVETAGESMRHGADGADPRTVEQARKAKAKASEIVQDLERLRKSFEDSATAEERRQMQELAKRQQELRQRAQQMAQQMGEMAEKTPFVPGQAGQAMQQASESMGDAQAKLRGGNAAGAVPSERDAMQQLGEAQAQMEGAGQSGQRGGRSGIPLGQRMNGRGSRGQNGMNGMSNDRVEIPDGSQFRVPKEFREDILEAMKKPSPNGYEQLNQDYYERLIK